MRVRGLQVTCSKRCEARRMPIITKLSRMSWSRRVRFCLGCGAVNPRKRPALFCNNACRNGAWTERASRGLLPFLRPKGKRKVKTAGVKLRCPHCRASFIQQQPNQKFCTRKCASEGNRRDYVDLTPTQKAANYKASRRWLENNREKSRTYQRTYARERYRARPEFYRRKQAKWRNKNRDAYNAFMRKWRKAHPEVVQYHNAIRKARKRSAPGTFTLKQWLALITKYKGCCAYCGKRRKLTVDHRKPIVSGGSNYINNILPACAPCNSKKRDKPEKAFRAWLRQQVP